MNTHESESFFHTVWDMEKLMRQCTRLPKDRQKPFLQKVRKILEDLNENSGYLDMNTVRTALHLFSEHGIYSREMVRKLNRCGLYPAWVRQLKLACNHQDTETANILDRMEDRSFSKDRASVILQWLERYGGGTLPEPLCDPSYDDLQALAVYNAGYFPPDWQGYHLITPQHTAGAITAILHAAAEMEDGGGNAGRLSFLSPAWKSASAVRILGRLILHMPEIEWENILPENCPAPVLNDLKSELEKQTCRTDGTVRDTLDRALKKWDGFTPALGQYYENHTHHTLDETYMCWQRDLRENSLTGDLLAIKLYADQVREQCIKTDA